MPEWLNYLVQNTINASRLLVKNRSIIKEAGLLLNKFRNGFLKDYGAEFDVDIDDKGNKKTKFETFLEGRKGLNSFLTTVSKGIRKVIDVATSPLASRMLFYIGAAVGIGLASTNPVTLGFVIAGTTISMGSVIYSMYKDVNKFRELRKLKQEQAMLEEMMTLKTQSKALAETLFKDRPDLAEKLGLSHALMKPINITSAEWEAINKKRLVGRTFLETAPTATIPLISSLVLGNIPGFFITLSGYILELCGSSARGVIYAKEKEKLMNANIALANNLGVVGMGFGQKNENLREGLAEIRAKNAALLTLAQGNIKKAQNLESEFIRHYNEQKKNIQTLKPELQERSWWQDARKIWYKDGTSYASTSKNFTPAINEYKNDFKTDRATYKPTVGTYEVELENQKTKQVLRSYTQSVGSKIDSHYQITFDDKLKLKVTSFEKQVNNNEYTALAKAVTKGESKRKILELYAAFKDSILPEGKDREDLTSAERNALKHANMVKFAAEKSSFVERENGKNKAKDSSPPQSMMGG